MPYPCGCGGLGVRAILSGVTRTIDVSLARRPVSAVATEPIEPDEVRAELARVLASAGFRSAPRRRELLRYLVEEMLAGRGDLLKGYSIATSVFGRGEDFDPQTDPVVRLEARRLRLDLADYYVSVGRDDPLRIEIPKGHYDNCERFA